MPYNEVKDPRDIVYTPADIGAIGTSYIKYRQTAKGHGIPIGLESIDGDFLPALPGELVSIIGRPGGGKTGFMMRWARQRSRDLVEMGELDRLVIFITLEQHIEELHAFHVAAEERFSATEMARGNITDEQMERIEFAGVNRVNLPLWFMGHSMERRKKRPKITVGAMARSLGEIEKWHDERYTIDAVFVDYLQRIPFEGRVESKVIGVSENLDRLKDGALAYGCPFIVGVQAKREVDQKSLQIPAMDDGQWTSNIEQASDKVISVVRPRKYRKEGEMFGSVLVSGHCQMLVSVLKQKLGADNKAYWVYFQPEYNKLDELESREDDYQRDYLDEI